MSQEGSVMPVNRLLHILVCGAASIVGSNEAFASSQDQEAFFESRIRPLLIEHCVSCHGDDKAKLAGGLDLSSPSAIHRGGDSGSVLVPGNPAESALFIAISYATPEFQMPPSGKLSNRQIDDVRKWIEQGAVMPVDDGSDLPHQDLDSEPYDWDQARTHWAYRPMSNPKPPSVQDVDWCRNEIDHFVLARLEQAGLEPAPEADRRTLIRRAYFDLIGLPPTPEEVNRFLADESPNAFERMVDELLLSPHYGERWGRHWLDVARYADSNGLDENTAFGNAWRYRDWVVRAFNSDKRFDEFIVEQIAGDLLLENDDRDVTVDRLIATGFLSLGPKVLAEPDKEKMRIDIVDEQLDILSQAFLAQTIGCARCHDHKFDPITIDDYYAMAGIFYSTRTMETYNTVARVLERDLATTSEINAARSHAEASKKNAQLLREALSAGGAAVQKDWLGYTAAAMVATTELTSTPSVREAEDFDASNLNVNYENYGPGIGIIHTNRPDETQYVEYIVDVETPGVHEIKVRYASGEERPLDVLVNGQKVASDLCKSITGSFAVTGMQWTSIEVELPVGKHTLRFERPQSFPHLDRLFIINPEQRLEFTRDIEQVAEERGIAPDLLERWALALESEPIFAPWRTLASLDSEEYQGNQDSVFADLVQRYSVESAPAQGKKDRSGVAPHERAFLQTIVAGTPPGNLGDFAQRWQAASQLVIDSWERLRQSDEKATRLSDAGQETLRAALIGEGGVLYLSGLDSDYFPEVIRNQVNELVQEQDSLRQTEPGMMERGIAVEDGDPTDLPVFIRGDHTKQEENVVPRRFLTVLEGGVEASSIGDESSGRLELAQWIVDSEHPLTARVAANRIWHWHFGQGIVSTPSNFGMRGGQPSHPELLDWLAQRFVAGGWSMKKLHRLILSSATWRMGGDGDSRGLEIDPDNSLRWYSPPKRLEAEAIRDSILALGGSLDRTIGGSLLRSSGFGYVTNDQSNSNETYTSNRRAIYMPVIRNDMYPFFSIFDYTDSSIAVDARSSTMVAQQALFMLNSPMVGAQAERIANQLLSDETLVDDAARIARAYEMCFARTPTAEETSQAIAFLDNARNRIGPAPSISWPEASSEPGAIDEAHHAMRNLCQVLLASNEHIYVR